jgi:hypothetical protein
MSVVPPDAAAPRGARLRVVEPFPSPLLKSLAQSRENVDIVAGFSPAALADTAAAGLYVVDGDHNYVTVKGELEAIFSSQSRDIIAVMHDVGWPSGRRDQYYAPDRLPADAVWPHSFTRGALLDSDELADDGRGFRGEGSFAFARHEGGPRNGVHTAIDDFLAARSELAILETPLVFGLGVIGHRTGAPWPTVQELMTPYTENPTLAAMERNRIELLLRVIELQDSSVRARAGRARKAILQHDSRRARG